ncbi:hypothetical protein B0H13DRAFT_2561822 [Mycena leptocephala]|nr:hypothetical protein B0H13DRAFT_2561822 [Mycena leptocephala]
MFATVLFCAKPSSWSPRTTCRGVPPGPDETACRNGISIHLQSTWKNQNYLPSHRLTRHQMRNDRVVSYETPPPDLEAREALRAYRDAYDAYFMSRGNDYAIRNAAAKSALEAAEQTWHDWIVPYLAARGTPGRPDWALQPLPGLQRVRVARAPAPARTPTSTPRAQRRQFPSLPTPPPSSPAPVHIDLSHIDEPARPPQKRKFLGEIDISDDEADFAVRPRKKAKFLGYIDLTN